MRTISVLAIADNSGYRETGLPGDLYGQNFLEPGTIRPLQNKAERELGDLIIVGDPDPAAIGSGEPSQVCVDDAPELTDTWVSYARDGWKLVA